MIKLVFDDKSYNLNIPDVMIAYDTCHKIYLTRNPEEVAEAISYGYELYPVEELPRIWNESCGLRFVDLWDVELGARIVQQCVDANIYYDDDVVIELPGTIPDDYEDTTIKTLTELGYVESASGRED